LPDQSFENLSLDFLALQKEPDSVAALSTRLDLDITSFEQVQTFNKALDIQTSALTNTLVNTSYKPSVQFNKIIRAQLDALGCTERLLLGLDFGCQTSAASFK
jgi:hypothetical protein